MNAETIDSLFAQALAAEARGTPAVAEAAYKNILDRHGHIFPVHYNMGVLLLGRGAFDDALYHLMWGSQINPGDANCAYATGLAFSKLGKTELATVAFRRTLEINQSHPLAHINLANLHVIRAEIDQALKHYDLALGYRSDLAEAHIGRAAVFEIKNDRRQAVAAYAQAVAHSSDTAGLLAQLGLLMNRFYVAKGGQLPKRIAEIELSIRAGDFDGASARTSALMAERKDNPEVYLMAGKINAHAGDVDTATLYFANAVLFGNFHPRYVKHYDEHVGAAGRGLNAPRAVFSAGFLDFFDEVGKSSANPLDIVNVKFEKPLDWKAVARLDEPYRLSTFYDEHLAERGQHIVKNIDVDVFVARPNHPLLASKKNILVEHYHEIPTIDQPAAAHLTIRNLETMPCLEISPFDGRVGAIFTPPKRRVTIDQPGIYIGGSSNFGHFLLDHLPKLFGPVKLGLTPGRKIFTYIGTSPQQRADVILPQIEATRWLFPELEFTDLAEHGDSPMIVELKSAIVPSYVPAGTSFMFLNERLDAALKKFDKSPEKLTKIYVSRGDLSRVHNEEEIIRYLRGEGFTVVNPFERSFMEMASIYRNVKVIVSSFGSHTTNKIFCKPGVHFVELRPHTFWGSPLGLFDNRVYVFSKMECHFLDGIDRKMLSRTGDGSHDSLSEFPLDALKALSRIWK